MPERLHAPLLSKDRKRLDRPRRLRAESEISSNVHTCGNPAGKRGCEEGAWLESGEGEGEREHDHAIDVETRELVDAALVGHELLHASRAKHLVGIDVERDDERARPHLASRSRRLADDEPMPRMNAVEYAEGARGTREHRSIERIIHLICNCHGSLQSGKRNDSCTCGIRRRIDRGRRVCCARRR